jgi:voltage-gated potassium channel
LLGHLGADACFLLWLNPKNTSYHNLRFFFFKSRTKLEIIPSGFFINHFLKYLDLRISLLVGCNEVALERNAGLKASRFLSNSECLHGNKRIGSYTRKRSNRCYEPAENFGWFAGGSNKSAEVADYARQVKKRIGSILFMPQNPIKRIYFACLIMLVVTVIGTVGYYLLGQSAHNGPPWKIGECLYMTIITLTTVGFGEIIDLTRVPGARTFTIIILLGGLGVAAYFVSTLTAFLVEGELTNVFWRKKMEKQIRKLTGHIIICSDDSTGVAYYVIEELHKTGTPFVLVGKDEQVIKNMQLQFGDFPVVIGDPTHADYLSAAEVQKASGVISVLSDDKDNLCVVVTCRQLNAGLKIISSCRESEFAGKLKLLGSDVVMPNSIGGLRIASQIIRPKVVRYLDLMMRDRDCVVRIEDITLSEKSFLVGKQVRDINFPDFTQLLVLALIRSGHASPIYNPV